MNIANIISRFALVSGVENSEIYRWRTLIDDAVSYVNSLVKKSDTDENDNRRLEMLCAVYAFKLYELCNDESISSFSVGDVKVASSAERSGRAEKMWREYAEKAQDLISDEKFLFGRVI